MPNKRAKRKTSQPQAAGAHLRTRMRRADRGSWRRSRSRSRDRRRSRLPMTSSMARTAFHDPTVFRGHRDQTGLWVDRYDPAMARRRRSVALWLVIALASMAIGFGSGSPSNGGTTRDSDRVGSPRSLAASARWSRCVVSRSDGANKPLLLVFAMLCTAGAVAALAVACRSRLQLPGGGRCAAGCVGHGVRVPPSLQFA